MKYFPSSFCEYGCILKALAFGVRNDTELQSGRGGCSVGVYTVPFTLFINTLKRVSCLKTSIFDLKSSSLLILGFCSFEVERNSTDFMEQGTKSL